MMDITDAVNIFGKSVLNYNVRYMECIGYGDPKAYDEVCSTESYGDKVQIRKIEWAPD